MHRYKHQISLPEVGLKGQTKLLSTSVLVVGAGGLGCPLLSYITGAGIGNIHIIDGDRVSHSNLHRQTLFGEKHIGKFKAEAAQIELTKRNSEINIKGCNQFLDSEFAMSHFGNYDYIVDCTDDISVKYLINDVCELKNIPWIHASLHHPHGQVSVFNYKGSGNYRCLFPRDNNISLSQKCEDRGILPSSAGIIGIMQANELIKIILEHKESLANQLLIFNTLTYESRKIQFEKTAKKFEVSEQFILTNDCYNKNAKLNTTKIESGLTIDIRSRTERLNDPFLSDFQIEIKNVEDFIKSNNNQTTYLLVCAKGIRSSNLAQNLFQKGYENIKSLEGGIESLHQKNHANVNG